MHPRIPLLSFALLPLLAPQGLAAVIRVPQDQPTIQAAVDAAGAGDEIVVAKGHWDAVLIAGKTSLVLRGKPGCEIVPSGPGNGIDVQSCTGVILERLEVRNAASSGIVITDSQDVLVSKCSIVNPGTACIAASTGSAVRIERNSLRGAAAQGVSLATSRSVVEKNDISDCQNDGVTVGGTFNVVRNNRVKGCNRGIAISGGPDNLLIENKVEDSLGDGISVFGASRNHVQGNRITRPGQAGITVSSADYTLVLGNVVLMAGANGIVVFNSDFARLLENRSSQAKQSGVLFSSADDGLAMDNLATSSKGDRFSTFGCDRCHLMQNRAVQSKGNGFDLSSGQDFFLVRNVAKKNKGQSLDLLTVSGVVQVDNRF